MSTKNDSESIPINLKVILGKGGPISGSVISIFGNLLVLLGFVLPWASCSGYELSGLDIVTQSISGKLNDTSGILLSIIPFLAIGILGVAVLTYSSFLHKEDTIIYYYNISGDNRYLNSMRMLTIMFVFRTNGINS